MDYYDANTKVLKDPYSLYDVESAQEFYSRTGLSKPQTVPEDYKEYVEGEGSQSVIGFRDGDKWFLPDGTAVSGGNVIFGGGLVNPSIKNPDASSIKREDFDVNRSFKDYEPQLNIMPRLAFSFPISDVALFFAHYDVLAQRPLGRVQLNITDFYYIESKTSDNRSPFNNPNLKPTKTVDYELGFQQKLSNTSSLNLSAFYRDMKDQVQVYRFSGAYPRSYYSYNNIDFGTVKGLTIAYDLRRTNNARVRAAYTLQFANGTGSNDETAKSLVTLF